VNDKHDYVGYSGGAGGMSERGGTFRIDKQALRRISRLEDAGINPKNKSLMNRPRCHCAEAAALSIAVSYGETLESLMFFAFDTEGKLMRPCSNCLSWLSGAAGYWDDYIKCNNSCGDGKPKRKRDDGDGDDSNKRRKVINAGS
jgi:hypothetical protein